MSAPEAEETEAAQPKAEVKGPGINADAESEDKPEAEVDTQPEVEPGPEPSATEPATAPRVLTTTGGASTSMFSLAELKVGCPEGVDPKAKETVLQDSEFEAALGCNRREFMKLAKWKRDSAKKKAGIF